MNNNRIIKEEDNFYNNCKDYIEISSERNKEFDDCLPVFSYYFKIEKLAMDIKEFADKMHENTIILAAGGNETIMKMIHMDNLNDLMGPHIENNSLLKLLSAYTKKLRDLECYIQTCLKNEHKLLSKVAQTVDRTAGFRIGKRRKTKE